MKLNHLIWTRENALSSEFCKHVIDKFESDDRKVMGITTGSSKPDYKKSTDLNISFFSDWEDEDKVFYDSLNSHLDQYLEHCISLNYIIPHQLPNLSDAGYQIQRTKPGEYYHWHHDSHVSQHGIRYITYIWYLNDIHEDGYTEFSNGVIVRPRTGKILFFPATWTYLHRGVSPISETKYICTGWLSYE
jgi:hypothetical protein